MQVCTSLQIDNNASTTPLKVFLQAGCPSCRPTNSVKALKAQYSELSVVTYTGKTGWLLEGLSSTHQCKTVQETTKGDNTYTQTARDLCKDMRQVYKIGSQWLSPGAHWSKHT